MIQMRDFEDQLKKKGEKFRIEMDKQQRERFSEVLSYLAKAFNAEDDIYDKSNNGEAIRLLLKRMWELGFYSGVNFCLDPETEYLKDEQFFE